MYYVKKPGDVYPVSLRQFVTSVKKIEMEIPPDRMRRLIEMTVQKLKTEGCFTEDDERYLEELAVDDL